VKAIPLPACARCGKPCTGANRDLVTPLGRSGMSVHVEIYVTDEDGDRLKGMCQNCEFQLLTEACNRVRARGVTLCLVTHTR
jgi:hypothetical protein